MEKYIAIGDIHGRHNLLMNLLNAIFQSYQNETLVFLGDYVDKGSHSKEVIQTLIELKNNHLKKAIFLKGNHDEMFELFISNPNASNVKSWVNKMNGYETLNSYSEDINLPNIADYIPHEHKEFMRSLLSHFETENLFFCHSGGDIEKELTEQTEKDLIWARPKEKKLAYNKTVIHGHTPTSVIVKNFQNRINLDLGAGDGFEIGAAIIDSNGNILKTYISGKWGVTIQNILDK